MPKNILDPIFAFKRNIIICSVAGKLWGLSKLGEILIDHQHLHKDFTTKLFFLSQKGLCSTFYIYNGCYNKLKMAQISQLAYKCNSLLYCLK